MKKQIVRRPRRLWGQILEYSKRNGMIVSTWEIADVFGITIQSAGNNLRQMTKRKLLRLRLRGKMGRNCAPALFALPRQASSKRKGK